MNTMEKHWDYVQACMEGLKLKIALYKMSPGPKQSGAVRRASMDLTRALAEMRAGK